MADTEIPKLYLQLHDAELKNRDAIVASLGPFTSTLTLLGGGAFYLVTHIPAGAMNRPAGVALVACLVLGVAVFLLATGFVLAALWSRYYSHAPSLGAIERWRVENEPYHLANPQARPTLEERLWAGLAAELAAAADANRASNRAKGDLAYKAKVLTTVSLGLFGGALVCFLWVGGGRSDGDAANHKTGAVAMTDSKSNKGGNGGQSQSQDPPKQTPFPPRENLREGNEKAPGKPLNETIEHR